MATGLENSRISETGGVKWLPVVGYEGIYEVSNAGGIRRVMGGRGATSGRILTLKRATNGYRHVDLSRGDRKTRFGIHRLVAFAFIGPPPTPAHIINHIDGDKTNNIPTNLEWATHAENISHAYRTGLNSGPNVAGEQNPRAKLTQDQVMKIRALKGMVGARVLAQRYRVSRSAIQFIHQDKHWI